MSIYLQWLFSMNINLNLHQLSKKSICSTLYRNLFKEILSSTLQHALIFMDASFRENCVGMAIIHSDTQIQWKLSNKCSIYTAEALVILKTIEYSTKKIETSQILILNDSLSILTSLRNQRKPTDIA